MAKARIFSKTKGARQIRSNSQNLEIEGYATNLSELAEKIGLHLNTIKKYRRLKMLKEEIIDDYIYFPIAENKKIAEDFLMKNNGISQLTKFNKKDNKKLKTEDIQKMENSEKIYTVTSETLKNEKNENFSSNLNEEEYNENNALKKYEKGNLSISEMLDVFDDVTLKRLEIIEKTRKQKIDNDEKEGLLISKSDVEFQLETLGKFLKDRIFEMPNRLSVELASIEDPLKVKIYLKEELVKIFEDFEKDLNKILN